MRVMVLVKASPESEAGELPPPELLAEMGRFNDELLKAGVLLAAEGLRSSAEGRRVRFANGSTTVVDGPFTESKELIAGYWIWEVASLEEAVEWLRRSPFEDTEVEIRTVQEIEDFAGVMTPAQLATEYELRGRNTRES